MEKEAMTDWIAEYFDNTLNEAQRQAFEEKLKNDPSFAKEVTEYQLLFEAIKSEEKERPSENLEANFLRLLEEEKRNRAKVVSIAPEKKNWMGGFLKVAASVAVLISIFYLGRYSQEREAQGRITLAEQQNVAAKQMAVLAMMENQSANKRIQGVQFVEELATPDEDIIKALADRMQHDENTNVRIAALEALARFPSSEQVKSVFLKTLETEKNPSIQIALIQYLVSMQERKAVGPMQRLLEQEDTQPFIKAEINQALPKII